MSASYHMLSAPDAPAPTAMQISAMTASAGCSGSGASTMPTSAVNTTSDITRGFIRAMKSPMLPPTAWAECNRCCRRADLSHLAFHHVIPRTEKPIAMSPSHPHLKRVREHGTACRSSDARSP